MSPGREAELARRHPSYDASRLQDGGAACGDGWFDILDRLIGELETQHPQVQLIQVKQKIGRLRVYAEGASEEAATSIRSAVEESGHVCEVCGAPGTLRQEERRVATRCGHHREKAE